MGGSNNNEDDLGSIVVDNSKQKPTATISTLFQVRSSWKDNAYVKETLQDKIGRAHV